MTGLGASRSPSALGRSPAPGKADSKRVNTATTSGLERYRRRGVDLNRPPTALSLHPTCLFLFDLLPLKKPEYYVTDECGVGGRVVGVCWFVS